MAIEIPEDVMKWFRQTGAEGGRTRARKYGKEQLSEWGKLGGRPKGSTKGGTKKEVKRA